MKKLIVLAVLFGLMFPCVAEGKLANIAVAATTSGGTTVLNTSNYTVINNSGSTGEFFWNCEGDTVGIAATNASINPGESLEVNEPCGTMTWDTTTGNATIRIFYEVPVH